MRRKERQANVEENTDDNRRVDSAGQDCGILRLSAAAPTISVPPKAGDAQGQGGLTGPGLREPAGLGNVVDARGAIGDDAPAW